MDLRMITNWRLRGFKSVQNKTDLHLAPLTVLVGPNSSGKSSVIQSILVTAQTMADEYLEAPMLWNGPLTVLGQFSDVVTQTDDPKFDKSIGIGFTFTERLDQGRFGTPIEQNDPSSIELDFTIDAPAIEGNPRVHSFSLEISSPAYADDGTQLPGRQSAKFSSRVKRSSPKPDADYYGTEAADLANNPKMSGDFIESHSWFDQGPLPQPKNIGVKFQQFLPVNTAVGIDYFRYYVQFAMLSFVGRDRVDRRYLEGLLNVMPSAWKHLWTAAGVNDPSEEVDPDRLSDVITDLSDEKRLALRQAVRENLIDWINAEKKREGISYWSADLPEPFAEAVRSARRKLSTSIWYLGPVREQPKWSYTSYGLSRQARDVGIRGEYTASVLASYGKSPTDYVNPLGESVTKSLEDATADWLEYFDLGRRAEAAEERTFGTVLKIADTQSQSLYGLPSLGYGVSQVLPIIVVALVAPVNSTILLEQPELHLHPRLQSRIADFLLFQTRRSKQFIVESHSEHFINRIRLRIAQSEDPEFSETTAIYFTRREEGKSTFERVKFNKYGAYDMWPEGFFDEASVEAQQIMEAGIDKRRSE